MKVIAKYPIKIGSVMVPKGTEGRTATLEEIRHIFPSIDYKQGSTQIAVKFFDLKPCIVHENQIILNGSVDGSEIRRSV